MKHFRANRLSVRLFAALLALLLVPFAALADSVEVEDVPEVPAYALPIDFTPGPMPKDSGFSQSKDENGNTVHTYEDSTIHAIAYKDVYKGPDGKWGYTDIWVADVQINDPSQFRVASFDEQCNFANPLRTGDVVTLADKKHVKAVVAVNGDSWGANSREEKNGFGVVFRQGQLIKNNLDDQGKFRMDLLIVDAWGDFHGVHAAQAGDLDDPSTFEGKKVMDVFSFGPILVENGEAIYDYQGTDRRKGGTWMYMKSEERAQRIAICQLGPLHYLIAASASDSGNRGLTLTEFADYLVSKGAQFAYNLDGGVSSVLYFPGAGKNGKFNLKNRPQGRGLWDIIYFATAEK